MTGNMLFEIIDPFLMWKQIYISVREAIKASNDAVRYVVVVSARFDADLDGILRSQYYWQDSLYKRFDFTMKKFRNCTRPSLLSVYWISLM